MGRKSSVAQLPPPIKAAVDEAIREGRASIDDIVGTIRAMGGEASRSAVHRYKASAEESMEAFRKAQVYADVWVDEARRNPDGKTSRLLSELLKTATFHTLIEAASEGKPVDAKDLMFLGATVKNVASAEKIDVEKERMIRADAAQRAAAEMSKVAKAGGLGADMIAQLREAVIKGGA